MRGLLPAGDITRRRFAYSKGIKDVAAETLCSFITADGFSCTANKYITRLLPFCCRLPGEEGEEDDASGRVVSGIGRVLQEIAECRAHGNICRAWVF